MAHPRPAALLWLAALTLFAAAACRGQPVPPNVIPPPPCPECQCPGDRPPDPNTVPTIDVKIERIDTARYPEVDLYFRVVDTNSTTDFHPLERADVSLDEGPSGGALTPANIVADNFANPQLRALATAVVLDRSSSVERVLPYIKQAINDFVDLMEPAARNTYHVTPGTPNQPDVTMVVPLAGNRFLEEPQSQFSAYDSSTANLKSWVDTNINRTYGGSPIFGATDEAVRRTARKKDYDLPEGSRLVFLITDGQENQGYPTNTSQKPWLLISNAQANNIRVYTMGMVFVKQSGAVEPDNICRTFLKAIANATKATYFEPINPFPVLPAAPQMPAGASATNPNDLDDTTAKNFLLQRLSTCANLAKNQTMDVRELPLPADFKAVLAVVMAPLPDPYTYKEFCRDWSAATLPDLKSLDQVTYAMLNSIQATSVELANAEVTPNDLKETQYYRDQVKKVLTKIQRSEKSIYKLTYRNEGAPFDGGARDIRLTVKYRSNVNGSTVFLNPGTAPLAYKAPSVLAEDDTNQETQFRVNNDAGSLVVFGPKDPRNQNWAAAPQFAFVTRLMTEVPNPVAGQPPVQFPVASYDPNNADPAKRGYKQLDIPDAYKDLSWVVQHVNGEAVDYRALLVSLNPQTSYDDPSKTVKITLSAKTPTSITNPVNPVLRPVANAAEPARKRLMWYEISGVAERNYSYQTNNPPSPTLVTETATARVALPTFTYYVADKTPPSLGIYLTPSGRGPGMVAVRQASPDVFPQASKVFLQGEALGVPGDAVPLRNGFDAPPYQLEPTGSTPGFTVPQNIQVRIQVVGKDNFDRNLDHAYLLTAPNAPPSDAYDLTTLDDPAAKDGAPPYLPRVNWDAVGTVLGENKVSGVSWRLEEAGQPTDALTDAKIFRASNVSVVDDTFQVIAGQEIYLAVKASDAAGNPSFVRVPILVTPVGLNIGKLTYESRRAR